MSVPVVCAVRRDAGAGGAALCEEEVGEAGVEEFEVVGGVRCDGIAYPLKVGNGPAVASRVSFEVEEKRLCDYSRFPTHSCLTSGTPFFFFSSCACPISRQATPKRSGVRNPLFSGSEICQISPRRIGGRAECEKNGTARSPAVAHQG